MEYPTSSKKSKLDIPSSAKMVDGLIIPKVTGPLPSVDERFEIYLIDAEPLLEYASAGFRLFVSRFTDQILINYMSTEEFDVQYKALSNKYRWMYVIRRVWLKLGAYEKNTWEKNAKTKRCKINDSIFDEMLHQAIQQNLYEQSIAHQEKLERAAVFKPFLDANADELFINPSQMTFLVDFSPSQISPHAINFLKVCLNLDYFLDTLFEIDAERTAELLKYAVFYSTGKGDEDLRLSLRYLMPGLKTADQCDWIIAKLRKYDKHFDPRELSLFPLDVLERFFRRFNPIDYGEERARVVRKQAIDLGVIDVILDCLSFFAHQKARCKHLRPSHMDIAYFQIDYMTERRSTQPAKTKATVAPDGVNPELFLNSIGVQPAPNVEEEPDFDYYNDQMDVAGPSGTKKNDGKLKKKQTSSKGNAPTVSAEVEFYKAYAGADVPLAMNSAVQQPSAVNSGSINRRRNKPIPPKPVASTSQTTASTSYSLGISKHLRGLAESKFAKGTGYGSGSAYSAWNVTEHVAKKKYETEYVAGLLKILQAFIKPKSPLLEEILATSATTDFDAAKRDFLDVALSDKGDSCSMIDEKMMQLLNRSCLRKMLLAYLVNGSLLDITQNKATYETVFGLLAAIAQTGHVEAFASLFVIDNDEEDDSDSDDDDNADDKDGPSDGEATAAAASKQRGSGRIEQRKKERLSRSLSRSSRNTAVTKLEAKAKRRKAKDKRKQQQQAIEDVEVEHTSRQQIDVFHFLFLDSWFAGNDDERSSRPLLLNQLNAVTQQIDCYLKRMSNRTNHIQNQQNLSAEDLEMVSSDDEDRLRNLSVLSKLVCSVIEQKMLLADSKNNAMDDVNQPSTSRAATADDEKAAEEYYCQQMKPLQFETIPFFLEDSNQLAVSYKYQADIQANAASTFGKNIRRITQEIVSLSSALPLSASSSVFIRSCEERIHAAKMLITGPSGTPYSNGCFEFDIHFPSTYPNDPMRVNIQTTGNGNVRFNPNLYNCGKVCLSVLNTWSGRPEERWNAETSSLLQVIVSLQSLVLVPEPYFNEPGFQNTIGTTIGQKSSENYNSTIRAATVHWAMLDMLRNPPKAFASVIRRHFLLKRAEICKQIEVWIAEESHGHPANSAKIQADYEKIKKEFDALAKMSNVLMQK